MNEKEKSARIISMKFKVWIIICIAFIFAISSDCYAQNLPLQGQLEVTDSIRGLSEFNSSMISDVLYDERGVTIWQIMPEDIPYTEGLNFYAKMEGGNLSVMVKGENESMVLRGLLPPLTTAENRFLYASPGWEDASKKYDKSKTLIYYLLQSAFENLKYHSAISPQASLAGNLSYRSAFSDGIFIFGYYFSVSNGVVYQLGLPHNWPVINGTKSNLPLLGSASFMFNITLIDPTYYARYGWVFHSLGEDSKIFCNDDLWLEGPDNIDLKYGSSDFPSRLELRGKYNEAIENNSATIAMFWAAVNAKDFQVSGRVESQGKNQSVSSASENLDVNEKISVNRSRIIWPSLAIYDLIPESGSSQSSDEVLFSWRTTRNSSTELFYREKGEAGFRNATGDEGLFHSIVIPLKRNTTYEFYAFSNASDDSDESEHRQIYINNGVVFTQKEQEVYIDRDYFQRRAVSIKNTDTKPHEIMVSAENPFRDLYLGFLGNGSLNRTLIVGPGETKELEFVIHAQDTKSNHYDIQLRMNNIDEDNLTDNAVMGINIKWPEFNITITQIHEDTETLVKTFRIQNLGDTITDFSITLDDSLKDGAYIYPSVTHYNLVKDGSMEFFVIPLFKESGDIIEGNLIALWADGFKNYPLKFECLEGRRLYMAIAEMPMYVCDLSGWYCTNNPDIMIPFSIPPGFNISDVISAKIEMDFSLPWDRSAYTPHDVYLSVNGKIVGTIKNSIPEGRYVFEFAPGVLNYRNFSSADNVIKINTKHLPQSHYVVNTKIRIKLCLKKLERWICAPDEDTAVDHLWKTPGIEKNYPHLNVSILNPLEGEKLILGKPVLINVSVTGNEIGSAIPRAQRFAKVEANFSNEHIELFPLDDGLHGDGYADDGIYACTWVPEISGNTMITVKASNCRADSEGSNSTDVWVVVPDLNVTSLNVTPMGLVEGNPAKINFEVTNIGSALAGPHKDELYIDSRMEYLSKKYSLGPGESHTWNYNYTFTVGNHTLRACTDVMGDVSELDENNNCNTTSIYIPPSLDLNVTSIGFNGDLYEGSPITIYVNVTNSGNGTIGEHNDSLSIGGKQVKSTRVGALKSGETCTWSYNCTLTGGYHTIGACTDTNDTVNEVNEINNCKSITIPVTNRSDLNITDINVSGELLEGEPINISVNVTNQGNETAGTHMDRLFIDKATSYTTEPIALIPRENHTWRYSRTFTAGNHTISACTDTNDTVNEANESNNCRNTAFYVWPKSDLNITDINVSGELLEGEPINISVNVTNLGNGTARIHADHLSIDETQIASADMGAHYPKEESTWICNYTFTTPGNHTIRACMDASGDLKESNESNNCRDRTIYISPRLPDLNITDIEITGDHLEGLPVVISVNVTNKGKNVSSNHTDKLSVDGNMANLTNIGAVLPNENSTWICSYTFTPGYHTISACTDTNSAIEESSENNNCINVTIHIDRRIPDLNTTDIEVSGDLLGGLPIGISVNVTNQGNDTAVSHMDLLTIDGMLANSTEIRPLLNGTSYSLYYNYTGTAGIHNITACADAMGTVNEFNKNNNCRSRTIDIGFRSDLNITGIRVSGRLVEKAPINISVDDTNIGKGLAGNHTDGLFIDGKQVNLTKVKSLKPGETCTWSYNYCFTAGNHTISAYTDINGTVKESKEDNNSRTRTIRIGPLPDLNITDIQFQGDFLEGSPMTISVNVSNIGNDTAENHTDSLLIDGVLYNISMESGTLDPKDNYTWSCSYVFAAKNYTTRACTDTNDTIDESDESNNCRNRTIQIWPLPDLIVTSIRANGNISKGSEINITVNEGSPINFSVEITNLGKGIAGNYTDCLFIDGSQEPLTKVYCPKQIRPGESYGTLNYSQSLSSGTHHISAHADWSKTLEEISNDNNAMHINIDVTVIPVENAYPSKQDDPDDNNKIKGKVTPHTSQTQQ
jgi:subtilase family serine protease